MKKKLFLALLTTLLLLLAAHIAQAVSPSDFNCFKCGEPCTEWYPVISNDGATQCHAPTCLTCWAVVSDAELPCTYVEGTATCTHADLCSVCGYPDTVNGTPDPNAHDISRWLYNSSTLHYRRCQNCYAEDTFEYEDHYGGTATCSQPAICEVCSEPYGEPDSSGLISHPNPTIEEKPGTCYDEGYYRVTCDEPGCAMPFYEIATPANGQHIYNNWQPLGDGSHISACHYCGEELTVPCTVFTAELFAACPICGEYEGGMLLVVCAHDDDESLPYGTLVIRGGEIAVDGAMCAITVAGSYGGQVVELIAPVTVRVPMELTGFRVVDMNGVDVPFTLEDGVLTFETATAGLFLLVPAE